MEKGNLRWRLSHFVKEATSRLSEVASSLSAGEENEQAHPLGNGELFEMERSKLELDPGRNGGKPSVRRRTHGVFFFGIGKDAFNRLETQDVHIIVY